jgi:DNA-binding response OmpR family regulator
VTLLQRSRPFCFHAILKLLAGRKRSMSRRLVPARTIARSGPRGATSRNAQHRPVFVACDLAVDLNRHIVQIWNSYVEFTPNEYELLKVLVLNAGKLLTQRQLADQVWGEILGDDALERLRTTISALTPAETGSQPSTPPSHPHGTGRGIPLTD